MSRITTYLVGRDPRCDYRIDDATVSRMHAELVPAPDGRLYVTDRASTGGTFVRHGREWTRIRHAWVGPADWIRFGGHEMAAADLAALRGAGAAFGPAGPEPAPPGPVPDPSPRPQIPALPPPRPPIAARVEKKRPARDPKTGEIVEMEDSR